MSIRTIIDDVNLPFSAARFNIARSPIAAGQLDMAEMGNLPSCLDMLVKLPGGDLTLPEPYASDPVIAEAFRLAMSSEDVLAGDWRETRYVYLTVDRRQVTPGLTHRNAGWHFDGMQGARYPEKLRACHQYVASSRDVTEFVCAPIDASDLDEDRHNWFEEIGARVPADAEIIRPEPGDLVLMTAYQVHRSPRVTETGLRSFLRIDVSLKRQDRLGNTENPDLKAPWEFVRRDLPAHLAQPVRDAGWADGRKFGEEQ